jgi:hypothetical protein
MQAMDTILVLCTEGASYRNFVNAGVIDELKKKAKIVLVCADWMEEHLRKKYPDLALEIVYEPGKAESIADHIRMTKTIYRASVWPDIQTSTFKIIRGRTIKEQPIKFWIRRGMAIASRPAIIQAGLRKIAWLWPKKPVKELFQKYDITKVFSTNVLCLDHVPYAEYALWKNIPLVAAVLSWDNMTSKGTPMYLPNRLLMWGPKQKKECINLHNLPENILRECGAAQFDCYFKNDIPTKSEVFSKLKIPKNAKVITYVGGIPANVMGMTAENEKVIVDTILQGMDDGSLPSEAILVIRPHPGVKDWEQYQTFEKHPKVRMNYPAWFLQGKEPPKSWNPNWEDHKFMGALMKYSSVAITPGGSATLDAACFDNPAVNVYFDTPPRPYLFSLKSHCDFAHLIYLREFRATPFVESTDELLEEVKDGFEKPAKYKEGRKKMLDSIIGAQDGKSAVRTAEEVLDA